MNMFSRGRKILGLLNTLANPNEVESAESLLNIDPSLLDVQDQENAFMSVESVNSSSFDLISYIEKPPTPIPIEVNTTKREQIFSETKNEQRFPSSLVSNYDSESSIDDDNLVQIASRRSSTSSSTSSNSSSSSSTSSNETNTQKESPFHFLPCNSANVSTLETNLDTNDIIENTPENNQLQSPNNSDAHNHRSCFNSSFRPFSPIYTDESDVDDDVADPTYEDSIPVGHTRRFCFVPETSSSSDSEIELQKRGRKRQRRPHNWKQNKTKLLRNTGEEYVSLSKTQKLKPSRCLKVPCGENCRLKCTQNIDTEERYIIFRDFWKLGDLTKQRDFIKSCMSDLTPKYKYTNAETPRAPNKAYYFVSKNLKVRVCKKLFKSTLDVSDRMIHTIQHKITSTGMVEEERRGKHGKHKRMSSELIADIRKHIDSIPRIESHYVRSTTSRQYIDGGKSIKDLYNDFADQQVKNNRATGNYISYYKIFTIEYNLSFFQPRKDQCDLCTSYTNLYEDKKQDLKEIYEKHLKEKELSRREKDLDRQNINFHNIVAVYDQEAVLQCPRGTTSAFYYKSKLNSFNMTLTELQSNITKKEAYKKVNCYFWSESDAKRGAIEIGSCVWHYLNELSDRVKDSVNKKVIFYSDSCCGQNKNKYNVCLYLFAVHQLNIDSITHKFLIRGHTQNEADSVHSLIEREIKKNLKSGPIYSPDQYVTLIKNAKKSPPPINVYELTFESFFDTKKLQEDIGYNFNVNTEGESVNWNEIKYIKVTKESPFIIYYKTSFEQESYKEINIRNKRKKMISIESISLEKAYTGKQGLSTNKKNDLQDLLNKGLIPPFYKNVYDSILNDKVS